MQKTESLLLTKNKKPRLKAIEEMELLGHSFYVFLDTKTHTVQVLCQRNDGDLGFIEPEI